MCVAAVLGDALHRVTALGGREGMPRSLGSVYGGAVTRFLGGGLRGVDTACFSTGGAVSSHSGGVALTLDGCTLLLTNAFGGSHAIHEFRVGDGSRLRVIGGAGDGPMLFEKPFQVSVARDGFVFVADYGNDRVQVLTPALDFHGFVGVGQLDGPVGVCANADVVVVSEETAHRLCVFNRGDSTVLARIGCEGDGDGQLQTPRSVCFVSGDRHVAVCDWGNDRVSVFRVDGGDFIRHVGVGVIKRPDSVACSPFDELVVADTGCRCVRVFGGDGELLMTFGRGYFSGVAVSASGGGRAGCRVLGFSPISKKCTVWS